MGSYLDSSDAILIALTRERRAEARARMAVARAEHEALAFPSIPRPEQDVIEAGWRDWTPPTHFEWKERQWKAGNRLCGYCSVRMTRASNVPRTCTVDHRKPKAYGGLDEPGNWLLACLRCNNLKGDMSEHSFRRLICKAA